MTTRRSLMRGAAWSVPALAVATAAPAFAASSRIPAGLALTLHSSTPTSVHSEGQYNLVYQVTNTGRSVTTGPITLVIPHPASTTRVGEFNAPGWTVTEVGTTVTATLASPLAPGAMGSVTIRWRVNAWSTVPDIQITASLPNAPDFSPALHSIDHRIPLV